MSRQRISNLAKSVRDRLTNHARETREEFQLVLTRYSLERLLYRLSQSEHSDAFILKGAMLFSIWSNQSHRATRDLDLLGTGEPSIERMEQIFRQICSMPVQDDGMIFDSDSVVGSRIREDADYEGVRIVSFAKLEQARIPLQIDIGFGDAVSPAPVIVEYPVILDFPVPMLKAYPRETVVAEKFHAMVTLGMANTRMKDFYDLWVLARSFTFDGSVLRAAIRATFERRNTELPQSLPLALTELFSDDPMKSNQWNAFVRKSKLTSDVVRLKQIVEVLKLFLLPTLGNQDLGHWQRGGPWKATASPSTPA